MFELLIAKRMYRETDGGKKVSRPAVLIAIAGIAMGLAVMIIAVAVVIGFKSEVRDKVIGFGAHIQISNFDAVRSYETVPIAATDSMLDALKAYPGIKHVQRYSTKPGMIKTEGAFQGVVAKGVGPDFEASFFQKHLVSGEIPVFSDTVATNNILLSQALADKLLLKPGDRVYSYFIVDGDIRARNLTVSGIYKTDFSEYDNLFVLTDIYTINRVSKWDKEQVSGVEILIDDYSKLEELSYRIATDWDDKPDRYGASYYVTNIEQQNHQIFGWLSILDFNIWIILILMIGVAGFTVISGLLIIIIERTSMIGTLKAMGASNAMVRRIFLWFAVFLIGKGMLLGNTIALAIYFVQTQFGIIKLDPATYYMDTVPLHLNIWILLLLNVGTFIVSVGMLLGPSLLIARINPATSMRYE